MVNWYQKPQESFSTMLEKICKKLILENVQFTNGEDKSTSVSNTETIHDHHISDNST